MDQNVFIKTFADSINKLELLVFFTDNPSTMDTSRSLAIWTGLQHDEVLSICEQWVEQGLLKKEGAVFYFEPPESLAPVISDVVLNYKNTRRIFRKELMEIVAQKERESQFQKRAIVAEKGRAEAILQNISNGVIQVRDNQIISANVAFQKMFDFINAEEFPLSINTIIENELTKKEDLLHRGEGTFVLHTHSRHFEVTISNMTESDGTLLTDAQGEKLGELWIFHDITERIQIEKMKVELSQMITHDLRSPMTGIFTAFDMILREGEENMSPSLYKSSQLGRRTSQFILGLINDLIDIHRIEDGTVPIERMPLDFNTVIDESIEQVSSLLRDREINFLQDRYQGKHTVLGDKQKLIRVIVNLLTNALKFTPRQGTIKIMLTEASGDDLPESVGKDLENNNIMFSVADSGYGIPADSLKYIFEKYFRVEHQKRHKIAGTGLGLYFCQLIINAHGGFIWAESEEKKGSTFRVVLPAN